MSVNALIEDLEADQVLGYAIVSVASFVFYEYLIMLDYEIRYLWTRRVSFVGALTLLCRYLPFTSVVQIYLFASTSDLHQSNCILGFRTSTIVLLRHHICSISPVHLGPFHESIRRVGGIQKSSLLSRDYLRGRNCRRNYIRIFVHERSRVSSPHRIERMPRSNCQR